MTKSVVLKLFGFSLHSLEEFLFCLLCLFVVNILEIKAKEIKKIFQFIKMIINLYHVNINTILF